MMAWNKLFFSEPGESNFRTLSSLRALVFYQKYYRFFFLKEGSLNSSGLSNKSRQPSLLCLRLLHWCTGEIIDYISGAYEGEKDKNSN